MKPVVNSRTVEKFGLNPENFTVRDTIDPAQTARPGHPYAVLRLTLKRRWFDMIASGEKREEYRKLGPWILSRLEGKRYGRVEFRNGYGRTVPTIEVEYLGWHRGPGQADWGAGEGEYAVIRLGRVLDRRNIGPATDP